MPASTATELLISQWQVKVNGAVIPELNHDILRVEVDRAIFLPGMATIELFDRTLKWADDTRFAIGKPVTITVTGTGPGSTAQELFNGEITAIEANINAMDQTSTLLIRAYDKSHRLQRNRKARVLLQQKDSDAISATIREGSGGLSPDVQATTEVRDHIFQDDLTDYDFITRLARRNGMVVLSDGVKLSVKKPASLTTEVTLEYGVTLEEFHPVLNSTAQVGKVTVRGWDPATKAAVVGQASKAESGAAKTGWGGTGASLSSQSLGVSEVLLANVPISKQADGDAIAESELAGRWRRDVHGEGRAIGNPAIVAGTWLVLTKIGTRFGGKYFATRVRHVYTADHYRTDFWISGLEPETAADLILGAGQEGAGAGAGGGVAIGVVTNVEDPDKMGRVKLKFPWMDDKLETWWARMATPMTGKDRGIQFMPEVNDEVLVAFDRGDRGRPYVLGGLWNGKDAPPLAPSDFYANGKIVKQQIKTSTGHLIEFSEAQGKEHVSVTTAGKHELNLDDGAQKIVVKSKGGHLVEIDDNGTGKITIKSGGDVTVEAGGKVTVNAKMDAEVNGMNVKVEAKGNLELSGTMVKVTAKATLDLSSSGITSVKGSLVKIN
ncbi:MAG: hypothetical protein C0506_13215 [Anaerolinea sp.]|nr:hypothetical protein [Anaerolinea sp.]